MLSRSRARPLLAVTIAASIGAGGLAGCGGGGNQSGQAGNNAAATPAAPVPQTATEREIVRAMLELAGVTADDLVVDLGSGDGRIPIMAARLKGARGLGVEIDRARITESNANAAQAGVSDRVEFRQQDLFLTPLNAVTVLTLFLLPEINLQLRPKILAQMRAGTRVVSNTFDMDDWRPDRRETVRGTNIFLWVVPARVEGNWQVQTDGGAGARLTLTQRYQELSGTAEGGGRSAPIAQAQLSGDRIAFFADFGAGQQRYEGRVEGDTIVGTGWRAMRSTGG